MKKTLKKLMGFGVLFLLGFVFVYFIFLKQDTINSQLDKEFNKKTVQHAINIPDLDQYIVRINNHVNILNKKLNAIKKHQQDQIKMNFITLGIISLNLLFIFILFLMKISTSKKLKILTVQKKDSSSTKTTKTQKKDS